MGKNLFSITGLIIGSVIPDFEYFLRIENRSYYSHTWAGVLWFDLPLALLLCFVFHNKVRGPLILNVPYMLHVRFIRFYSFNWNRYFSKHWIIVICSILIGTLTHLISDRVTHKSSNLVYYSQELIENPKSIYRVIQITYSVIGLALCFLTVWQLPIKKVSYYKPDIRYWIVMMCIFLVLLSVITLKKGLDRVDFIVGPLSSFMGAMLAASVIPLPARGTLVVRG